MANSVWIALFPPADVAATIATTAPGVTEPAEKLHVTLVYLGMADALTGQRETIMRCLSQCAAECGPLRGALNGVGRFTVPDGEVVSAIYLAPDVYGLVKMRMTLVDLLRCCDVAINEQHDYTPHMTIAYAAPDVPTPTLDAPIAVGFYALTLCWADERITISLDGTALTPPSPSQSFSAPALAFSYDATQPFKPMHLLRTGTFTDSSGRVAAFTPEILRGIVKNFSLRRNAPITENHDYGRAVGRITEVYTDATADNLYGKPWWNAQGVYLLTEKVYDATSVELRDTADGGFILVGDSLTNYPAVDGLAPVALSKPKPKEIPMSDENPTPEAVVPPLPDFTALLAAFTGGQFTADTTAQMTAQFRDAMQQQMTQMQAQARADAARQIAEFQAGQQIAQFAQHVTTATLKRAHALPVEPARVEKFLLSLSGAQRTEAQAIFEHVVTAGLVSFDEIGSAGEGEGDADPIAAYNEAIADRVRLGMKKTEAISAVHREERSITAAYNAARQKGVN